MTKDMKKNVVAAMSEVVRGKRVNKPLDPLSIYC